MPLVAIAQEAGPPTELNQAPAEIELRLRVYWDGGPGSPAWSGAATLDGGSLSQVRPWGGRPNAPCVALQDGDAVLVAAGRPRPGGTFDVTAAGPRDGRFKLTLTAEGLEPVTVEAPLAQLASESLDSKLGPTGAVRVYRVSADRLRVRTGRKQLVFTPGESFEFSVDATLAGFPAHSPIDLQAELSAGRGGDPMESVVERATADADGSCSAPFALTLPSAEGVYTVRLTARRPSGFMRGWGKAAHKPLAERSLQLVVWDENRVTRLADAGTTDVEIDPTSSRWWLRMPEWKWTRRVPWLPKGPLGSEPAELVSMESGKWVRLTPASEPGETRWQAYPLPIDQPGAAHVLEVEVPDHGPQSLDLTLFDRDAVGRAVALGHSASAVTGGGRGADSRQTVVIRRLFWPMTDSPMLVISNTGGSDAHYGRVRIKSLGRVSEPARTDGEQRLLMAGLADAQLTKLLAATHHAAADGRYVYEDWQCFYDTAVRLADYVQLAGFNGAVVTVASAEGTLYPTAVLGGQCGLDWQLIATGMADLPRKDLLELLLREFDRRGLKLTVAMDLASAIPAVERAVAGGDAAVDLVDVAGRPQSDLPRYNPLNPLVRSELVRAVGEVAEKCRGHESFAGVAVKLHPESHAVLPGPLWGADEATIDAFLAAKQIARPADAARTPQNVRRALDGVLSDAWRDWRAASMAALYGEMAREVASVSPTARLHLLADGLLDDAEGRNALRPRLEERLSLDELLLERAIDRRRLAGPPNLTLVAPRFVCLSSDLNQAALAMQQNALLWSSPVKRPLGDAAQLLRSKRLVSLPGFKARSPFGADQTYTATTLQRIHFGRQADASLASLAADAPTGEIWEDVTALPLDAQRQSLRRLLRQAPAGAAEIAAAAQPLVGWTLRSERGACVLAVNPTDWPLKATFTIDSPQACTVRRLSADPDAQTPVARLEHGQHLLPVELPPHGAAVYQFDDAGVAITGVQTVSQPESVRTLTAEVDELSLRDLNAKLAFDGCKNLSFETTAADGLPAEWSRRGQAEEGEIRSNHDSAVDGAASVEIVAGAKPVQLASAPFAPPETRQLVMTFFVRADRRSDDSSLTIRYLADGASDELFTTIGAKTLAEQDGWRQFVFAEDLPLGAGAPVRIEFEARNVEVSIDKLELQALSFPLDYELGGEARRQRLALVHVLQSAKTALADGRLRDCEQTLDSYWAQFIQRHTPLVERRVEVVAEEKKPDEADAPKTSRGWKAYLPGFLR